MEQRDFDMTVALIERHMKRWGGQAMEANRLMDKEQAHQCSTAHAALDTLRLDFIHANQ